VGLLCRPVYCRKNATVTFAYRLISPSNQSELQASNGIVNSLLGQVCALYLVHTALALLSSEVSQCEMSLHAIIQSLQYHSTRVGS
jgi:hypothetical protein